MDSIELEVGVVLLPEIERRKLSFRFLALPLWSKQFNVLLAL